MTKIRRIDLANIDMANRTESLGTTRCWQRRATGAQPVGPQQLRVWGWVKDGASSDVLRLD